MSKTPTTAVRPFEVEGTNDEALFALRVYRGEGMALLAMNWRRGRPRRDFVGFAIEYKEPDGDRWYALKNRIGFLDDRGRVNPRRLSTLESPIQKFRWVHFPRNADMKGMFRYRVTPVFMNAQDELSYGEPQQAEIELWGETYPDLNVTFTRGFVSSQAFVDKYLAHGEDVASLLPARASDGLSFAPSHPRAAEALRWMGFEARQRLVELLEQAVDDSTAKVAVVAYDLSERVFVELLERLGDRLRIIIDDSAEHGKTHSGETQAAERLEAAGAHVKRQHMGNLQHNKVIVIDGRRVRAAVCGSTNFSWRGFFVQSNNAVILRGREAVKVFSRAFDDYWAVEENEVAAFGKTASARWCDLGMSGVDAVAGFSPYSRKNSLLQRIGEDIESAKSSVFYSLAFLGQTKGPVRDAITVITEDPRIFVYGIADRKVGGIDLQKPDGNVAPVRPEALAKDVPEPFKSEPVGGGGNRMHHKFVVIDFDKPSARVYLGSYNFSRPADEKNGENLLLIKDRRVAVSYMIEALRIFDHYHFRLNHAEATRKRTKLALRRPPAPEEEPWWERDYTDPRRIKDRKLFA